MAREFRILKDDQTEAKRWAAGEVGILLEEMPRDDKYDYFLQLERGYDGDKQYARNFYFYENEVEEIDKTPAFKNPCRFKVFVFDKIIVLEDLFDSENPTRTLTNGAEEALMALDKHNKIAGRPIIYKDTNGQYDEIIWCPRRSYGNKVKEFKWLGETDMQKAIGKCLADHITQSSELLFEEWNNVPVDVKNI